MDYVEGIIVNSVRCDNGYVYVRKHPYFALH